MFLVIGSNSFSGANFVDHLLSNGHDVIGISRSDEPQSVFLPYKINKSAKKFKFKQCDIVKDRDQFGKILKDLKPEYVVNFAAQGMVAQSWLRPQDWYMTNVVAQSSIIQDIASLPNLKKYLHFTTPEVYGSTAGWIKETRQFMPSTPYAISRAAMDWHLFALSENFGFPVVFSRAANIYGPGQQLYRIIPKTILCGRLNKKLKLDGGGISERSFIHIIDTVRATYSIVMDGLIGETYHVSGRSALTIRALVEKIVQQMNLKFEDVVEEVPERTAKDQAYLLESQKIRDLCKWNDEISLESGITETIDWVDKNLSELSGYPMDYIHRS